MNYFDTYSEQAVIGLFMTDATYMVPKQEKLLDILTVDDFYNPNHKILWSNILSVSLPCDIIKLRSKLIENKELEQIGNTKYLTMCNEIAGLTLDFESCAETVIELSNKRRIYSAIKNAGVMLETKPSKEVIDYITNEIERGEGRAGFKPVEYTDLVDVGIESAIQLKEVAFKGIGLYPVSFGLTKLDVMVPREPGSVITIAGRPSMGKSTFALKMWRENSMNNVAGLMLSLEVSEKSIALNNFIIAQSQSAALYGDQIRSGMVAPDDLELAIKSNKNRRTGSGIVYSPGSMTVENFKRWIRSAKRKYNIQYAIVDYVQLVNSKAFSREQEIAVISRAFKQIAQQEDILVINLAQLNRSVEDEKPPIPKLRHLRESGTIEQDSDVVIMLYRDNYYTRNPETANNLDIYVAKNRNGKTGVVLAYYDVGRYLITNSERTERDV